jgi:hypothetical protein
MKNQLQKALSLTKKTGDRLIVFDLSQDSEPFVVMDLNEYEKIVIGKSEVRGLTEDELLDKINRDIAIWRSEQNHDEANDNQAKFFDFKSNIKEINKKPFVPVSDIIGERREDFIPDWDNSEETDYDEGIYNEHDEYDNFKKLEKKEKPKKYTWKIPSERKEAAEEVLDEDFQYLEKI